MHLIYSLVKQVQQRFLSIFHYSIVWISKLFFFLLFQTIAMPRKETSMEKNLGEIKFSTLSSGGNYYAKRIVPVMKENSFGNTREGDCNNPWIKLLFIPTNRAKFRSDSQIQSALAPSSPLHRGDLSSFLHELCSAAAIAHEFSLTNHPSTFIIHE